MPSDIYYNEHEPFAANWVVVHGDFLKESDVHPVDLILADPPYGIALSNNDKTGESGRKGKWLVPGDEDSIAGQQIVDKCFRFSAPLAVFASPKIAWAGAWRNRLVWDKGGAVGGGGDTRTTWKQTWELILIGGPTRTLNGGRDSDVLRYPVTQQSFKHHPNQKPVDLLKYLIEKLTQPGDTVLDPCCGSGGTGVACLETGRNFIGWEINGEYAQVARDRCREANRGEVHKVLSRSNRNNMKVVAFLQNVWLQPKSVPLYEARLASDKREYWLKLLLFYSCLTGKRLTNAFGDEWCEKIIWEESTRKIGTVASAVFPPDPVHVREVMNRHRPDIVLIFGKVAESLCSIIREPTGLPGNTIIVIGPHPAARGAETVHRLAQMRESLDNYCVGKVSPLTGLSLINPCN